MTPRDTVTAECQRRGLEAVVAGCGGGSPDAWSDAAAAAIIRATDDEAWRVRKMAAKVIARHLMPS